MGWFVCVQRYTMHPWFLFVLEAARLSTSLFCPVPNDVTTKVTEENVWLDSS